MDIKMILKDGTEVELVEAGVSKHFVVSCSSKTAFQKIWNKMTAENLSEFQITENGNTIQTITGATLQGTQTVNNSDGTITGHFYLDGGDFVQPEDEYSEAGKILLGEE